MSTGGEDDRIVELLRGLDPGEPPVALGPGASLRGIAARRRTRRHALGAGLALALVGGGVAGGFLSARQDAGSTPVAAGPMTESSVLGLATSKPSRSATPTPDAAPGVTRPAPVSVPPSRPAGSATPGSQSSRAESSSATGPAQVALAVTGGRAGPDGGTVFDVGDAITVSVSVTDSDSSSAWFVSSYSTPGGGAEMSLVSCSAYERAGGTGKPTLRQSWSPHLNSPGNYLVSVDVTDICGHGGTRHVEEWVSVVAADASATPAATPTATPSTPPTSPSASASPSPTASPSH